MALTANEVSEKLEITVGAVGLDTLVALESEHAEVEYVTLSYHPHDISGGTFETADEIKIVDRPEDLDFV